MSAHTPGPWKFHMGDTIFAVSDDTILKRGMASKYRAIICRFDDSYDAVTKKQYEANAKLVASAPELFDKVTALESTQAGLVKVLNALIEETERIAKSCKEYDGPHTHALLMDSTKRARAALANAGKEK